MRRRAVVDGKVRDLPGHDPHAAVLALSRAAATREPDARRVGGVEQGSGGGEPRESNVAAAEAHAPRREAGRDLGRGRENLARSSAGAEPLHLLVDSTGLKLLGAGEWLQEKHGTTVADALNGQRAIAAKVVAQGGDYVLALKGNQGCLHDDVRTFLDDAARPAEASHTTVDGEHGRIETRTSLVSNDIGWLQDQHAWPGLKAIGKVVRARETGTQASTETACYLLSTSLSAARFGEVARSHWTVENGLHWVLDVAMNEDQARSRKDYGPRNIALLRRLALNLAKLEGSKESMKGKLYRAALSETFLTRLLTQFGKTQMQ